MSAPHTDVKPSFQPARTGDVLHSYASIAEAHHGLGYEPRVSFLEGLRATVAYLEKEMDGPRQERAAPRNVTLAVS